MTEPTVRTITYQWPMQAEDIEYARFLNTENAEKQVKPDGMLSFGFLLYRAEPELFERGKREWREGKLRSELDQARAEIARIKKGYLDYEARNVQLHHQLLNLQSELKRAKRVATTRGRKKRNEPEESREAAANGNS